jgi:hypothetical protein
VTNGPQEQLRELADDPQTPRDDLWNAIARAVIDIGERSAVLRAEVEEFRSWIATRHPNFDAGPVQPR